MVLLGLYDNIHVGVTILIGHVQLWFCDFLMFLCILDQSVLTILFANNALSTTLLTTMTEKSNALIMSKLSTTFGIPGDSKLR